MAVATIGDLAALSLERLIAKFRRSYGSYLYEASRGVDESLVITQWEPRSMSRETTFENDVTDQRIIRRTLAELADDLVLGMRESGCRARTVTVKVRFQNFKTMTRAKTMPRSSDSLEEIGEGALEALGRVKFREPVRLVGIRVSNFDKDEDLPLLPGL